jgi:hypothetical protein
MITSLLGTGVKCIGEKYEVGEEQVGSLGDVGVEGGKLKEWVVWVGGDVWGIVTSGAGPEIDGWVTSQKNVEELFVGVIQRLFWMNVEWNEMRKENLLTKGRHDAR